MPKHTDIRKVLVIGSGPIIIGQAAEFDYAGTQACRALKEAGVEVVLVNSNPATIMTDTSIADKVYIEPMTADTIRRVIEREHPDSILPTLGGQTGLNLAMELNDRGDLAELGVRLLGTTSETIYKAEDREAFKTTMEKIGQPVIEGVIVTDEQAAVDFANRIGYPVIVRPAYTLGGTGGGSAHSEGELRAIVEGGLKASRVHQCLIERSVAGWKEIEYEVIRDNDDNCITVCNMENLDPVGIHTGDSIVVAPCQTVSEHDDNMLRQACFAILRELGLHGACNVQFALDPNSSAYYLIEVNPRLSRSSALASKATGYPIARVATKIAIGYNFDEIPNSVTGATFAGYEPNVDYAVIKFPRWPFDKFTAADKSLGTRMKATGEVMAIGENFEAAFLKAVRSLEMGIGLLHLPEMDALSDTDIRERLFVQDDKRMFYVIEALRRGIPAKDVYAITKVDWWFLAKFQHLVDFEGLLASQGLNPGLMRKAKILGFSDKMLALLTGQDAASVRQMRVDWGILPAYRVVDTCTSQLGAVSPYYYSTYNRQNQAHGSAGKSVVVLGSGPIRIGQGIEFDYCSVHCVWALKQAGYETIIINNNPETVSTDFDTADKLYFEPLTDEDVWNILAVEKPLGVVVAFGGQTAIKLTAAVDQAGYRVLGTQPKYIDMAEDRKEFDALLERLDIKRPVGTTVFTEREALDAAERIGYPVLVRPSYVLGGQGMVIAYEPDAIVEYMKIINLSAQEHPILIDKYVVGREVEVDALCDGRDILIPGIMEHIERTGVHSGDSISVYPAMHLSQAVQDKLIEHTRLLAQGLQVVGLVNIQYIVAGEEVYIIEVNPRSSRTIPYISKVTGIPMVDLATRVMLGERLADLGYGTGLAPESGVYAIKVPVFSFEKLPDVEVSLGPEMKSTGEVLGLSRDYHQAVFKGMEAAGMHVPQKGGVLMTVADADKQELLPIAEGFENLGYALYGTQGTAHELNCNHIATNVVPPIGQGDPDILQQMDQGKFDLVINTPTHGRQTQRDGFRIRRKAVELKIPCLTSLDTAGALLTAMEQGLQLGEMPLVELGEIEGKEARA